MVLTKQQLVREKLQTKIFDVIGKTVTLKKKDTPTYNSRGEEEDTTYSESEIIIVPYNVFSQRQEYEAFGAANSGDFDFAVPYDTSIDIDDLITMEGEDWRVKDIEPSFLPEKVVIILRVSKVQP